MVVTTGLVAEYPVDILPPPAQSTLDLLASYNVPYPGNKVRAPSVELITLSQAEYTETVDGNIYKFLTEIYPKLKPNNYTNIAMTIFSDTVTDPSTESSIYNFYSISNNENSDIVPPDTAKPLNAAITDLERTYSQYGLYYIFDIFAQHSDDILDNPHHDTTLVNVWNDFFNAIYKTYTLLIKPAMAYDAFVTIKTGSSSVATIGGWSLPIQQTYLVPEAVELAMLNSHDTEVDALVHPALQTILSAEIDLPRSTLCITPDLFWGRYPIVSTPTTIIGSSHSYYYGTSPLLGTFPRMNSTLFLQADVNLTDTNNIYILNLSSSTSTDTLTIVKNGTDNNKFHIAINFNSSTYDFQIITTSNVLLFALQYTTTGISVTYINQSNAQIVTFTTINNLTLDYDTIQIGIPCSYRKDIYSNVLETFLVYDSVLTTDQLNLLFTAII